MSKQKETQKHLIRIREVLVIDAHGGPQMRFFAKDLLSGVGASGKDAEAARTRLMQYYSAFPEKLPGKPEIGPSPVSRPRGAKSVRASPCGDRS